MELAFEQKQEPCLRRAAHLALAQEQTQELIIPDSMPDASCTLICYAQPELQSKTSRAGSLLVTGNLRTSCLYADETGGVQLLTAELPFTVKLESADLQETTQTLVRCTVRSADSRLINSRKVLLRVSVLAQADGYEPDMRTVRELKDPPACLQLKQQTYSDLVPVELGERMFQLSEELALPEGRPPVARLADCSLQLAVPFAQDCQLEGDYEDSATLGVTLCLTGVQLEPVMNEQSQKLLFGAGILAQCVVLQPQQLTVCEDAYATKGDFHPEWQEQERLMRLDGQTLREPVRQSFPAQAGAVLDCRVYPDAQAVERTPDGVIVHTPLRADVVYTDEDGAVRAETFRTEVSCRTALCENGICEASAELTPEVYAAAVGGAIELRCDAVFAVQTFSRQKLQELSGGTLEPAPARGVNSPSVVICRSRAQQDLWSLAKQYRTTAQAIQSANHLTQPEVEAGRLLLIPM